MNPTPTLPLLLKGREIVPFLSLQGGGEGGWGFAGAEYLCLLNYGLRGSTITQNCQHNTEEDRKGTGRSKSNCG